MQEQEKEPGCTMPDAPDTHERRSLFEWIGNLLIVAGALAIAAVGLLIYCTVNEFHPPSTEMEDVSYGLKALRAPMNRELSLISWNIGYGGLGEEADFFLDGGHDTTTYNEAGVRWNLAGITSFLTRKDPDFMLLQEVDRDSMRSFHIDETDVMHEAFRKYQMTFATNFLVPFLPYPIPPIGKVDAGLLSMSRYTMTGATRYSLPSPFTWPESTVNLKRCLLVSRIPIAQSDKQLVLVNLHLEAYDDGSGKKAQTKMLADLLTNEAAEGNYVIAGGDFNQTFSGVKRPKVKDGNWKPGRIDTDTLPDGFLARMDESSASCRSLDQPYRDADKKNFQYYIIDGFLVSSNVNVKHMHTIDLDFTYTDHNPIELLFTLEEEPEEPVHLWDE